VRRISDRSFEGDAGELVSIRISTLGNTATRVWLDGKAAPHACEFPMQGDRRVAVLAVGEPGEQVTVEVETADGVALVDVLLITTHDPFPIHHYGFRAI
jgi:hypothetical protein